MKERTASKPTVKSDEKSQTVKLLSGGTPQIPKADGDEPVQAYITAMPGWKHDVGKHIETLIVQVLPEVYKAVKWNSPLYGIDGQSWFLSIHCFSNYVRVTFFCGLSFDPIPPGGTPKSKEARWIDIHENEVFDEAQFASWVEQAIEIPGWKP